MENKTLLKEAQQLLETHTGLTSEVDEWSYESVLLGKGELDPAIVPDKNLLPMEVLSHQYLWIDSVTEKEYLVYFLTTIDRQTALAQGVVIEHKLVWSEDNQ